MLANLANMLLTCKLMDTKVLRCRRQHVGQVAGDTGACPRARPVRQPPCESASPPSRPDSRQKWPTHDARESRILKHDRSDRPGP